MGGDGDGESTCGDCRGIRAGWEENSNSNQKAGLLSSNLGILDVDARPMIGDWERKRLAKKQTGSVTKSVSLRGDDEAISMGPPSEDFLTCRDGRWEGYATHIIFA